MKGLNMFGLTISLLFASIVLSEGTKLITERYYEHLNCNKSNDQYDCGFLKDLNRGKCHFNGIDYNVDQTIPKEILEKEAKCTAACRCRHDYPSTKTVDWECVQIECPELFARDPSAVYKYSHDKCCAVSSEKSSDDKPVKEEGKCIYKDVEYHYGDKFYPDEEPCMTCICGEGFNGELKEPWCQKIKCNIFLHYLKNIRRNCIPLFASQNSCCPIYEFRCPSKDDAVITPKNAEVDQSPEAPKCKFGKLELTVGQSLSPKMLAGQCTECTCSVPPMVTCVMKECAKN